MSEIGNGHPECDLLLAMVDRDLPRASREVRRHVKECWKCRAHVEEFQATINDYARYQEQVLLPAVPPEPRPWMDLRLAMRLMDESRQAQRAAVRVSSGVSPKVGRIPWSARDPLVALFLAIRTAAHRVASSVTQPHASGIGRLAVGAGALACLALAIVLTVRIGHPPSSERVTAPVRVPTPPAAPVTARKLAPPKASNGLPSEPVGAVPPTTESSLNTEVRVFAALHRLGADLGEPVEVVVSSNGRVEVGGPSLAPARQAQLREALASEPKALFRFTNPEANANAHKTAQEPIRFDSVRSPLEPRLKSFASDRGGLESYANQVLDESDALLERAHALRTLAERFPEPRRSELHDAERATLDALIETHRAAFEAHGENLMQLVAPVLKALGAPAPASSQSAGTLEAAQRMDRVLCVIFGVAHTDLTPDQLLTELSNASAELSATLGGRQ